MTITNKELKELNISSKLFNEWAETLKCIWSMCQRNFKEMQIRNHRNEILLGEWKITASFINNSYITVEMEKQNEQMMCMRLNNNCHEIAHCINLLIRKDMLLNLQKKCNG